MDKEGKIKLFISNIFNKGRFILQINTGAVLPLNHPRYYEGRVTILLKKRYNHIYKSIVEIERNKYFVDEDTFNKIEKYVRDNFNTLLKIVQNQNKETYYGGDETINIKIDSMYIKLSIPNASNEIERAFLRKFKTTIIKMLSNENNIVNSN